MAKRNIIDENPPLGGNENGGEKEPRKRKTPNAPENALFSAPETPNDAGNTFTNPVTGASVTNEIKPYNDPFNLQGKKDQKTQEQRDAITKQQEEDMGRLTRKYRHKYFYNKMFDENGNVRDYTNDIAKYDDDIKVLQGRLQEVDVQQNADPFNGTDYDALRGDIQRQIENLTASRDRYQGYQNDIDALGKWSYYDYLKSSGDEKALKDYEDILMAGDDSFLQRFGNASLSVVNKMGAGIGSAINLERQANEERIKGAKTNEELYEEWKAGNINDEDYLIGLQFKSTKDALDEMGAELDFNMLDPSLTANKWDENASKYMQMALNGSEGVGRLALEIYGGIAPFAMMMLATGAVGAPLGITMETAGNIALGASAISSLGENAKRVYQETGDLDLARQNGILHATATVLAEKIGLDKWLEYMSKPAGFAQLGLLQFLIENFEAEALEEGVEKAFDPIIEGLTWGGEEITEPVPLLPLVAKYVDSVWDNGNLFKEMLLGGLGGGVLALGGAGFNAVRPMFQIQTKADYNTARSFIAFGEELRNYLTSQNYDATEISNTVDNLKTLVSDYEAKKSDVTDAVLLSGDEGIQMPTLSEATNSFLNAIGPDVVQMLQEAKANNDEKAGEVLEIADLALREKGINMSAQEFLALPNETRALYFDTADFMNENDITGDVQELSNLSDKQKDTVTYINDIATRLGIKPIWSQELLRSKKNGEYLSGAMIRNQMVLNPYSDVDGLVTFMHESIHGTEGTEAYQEFKRLVEETYEGGTANDGTVLPTVKDAKDYIRQQYDIFTDVGDGDVDREFVAIRGGGQLGNPEFISRLIKYNENLAYRIYDNVRSWLTTDNKKLVENAFMRAFKEAQRYTPMAGTPAYSIGTVFQAVGATIDKNGRFINAYDSNGNRISEVTTQMVKDSALGNLMDMAVTANKITREEADAQMEMYAGVCNLIMNTADPDLIWAITGSIGYIPVEQVKNPNFDETKDTKSSAFTTNSDKQYKWTFDVTTICKKTQQLIDVMSATMVELKRGLTEQEVIKIVYDEVANFEVEVTQDGKTEKIKPATVPCPVCYVFARWVGAGGLLNNIYTYQNEYADYSTAELKKRFDALGKEVDKIAKKEGIRGTTARTKVLNSLTIEYNLLKSDEYTAILSGDKLSAEKQARLNDLSEDMKILERWAWFEKARLKPSYEPVPAKILFDLNKGEEFANQFPDTWAYRTTRGPAAGKAITPYTSEVLGQTIFGIASNANGNTVKALGKKRSVKNNFYLVPENSPEKTKNFRQAIKKAMVQNLFGGSRAQSTSDFRFEYVLDYLLHFMELQAIGSKGQTYTKVPEAVTLLASVGYEVNMSLMPLGKGWEEVSASDPDATEMKGRYYKLLYSNVTGMNVKDAFNLSAKLDNAQPIMVGVNDTHILLCMADDRITFIIPYHASGASEQRYRSLMEAVNEPINKGDRSDYSNWQEDKFNEERTDEQIALWDARVAILTGKALTNEQMELISHHFILNDLYRRFRVKGVDPECYGVKMTKGDAGKIYPYEYWDTTLTVDQADQNGARFVRYCESMGITPRFTNSKEGTDFSQYSGYWKLLIDRCMYNNDGTYHVQQAINLDKFNTDFLNKDKIKEGIIQPSKDIDNSYTPQIAKNVLKRINGGDQVSYSGGISIDDFTDQVLANVTTEQFNDILEGKYDEDASEEVKEAEDAPEGFANGLWIRTTEPDGSGEYVKIDDGYISNGKTVAWKDERIDALIEANEEGDLAFSGSSPQQYHYAINLSPREYRALSFVFEPRHDAIWREQIQEYPEYNGGVVEPERLGGKNYKRKIDYIHLDTVAEDAFSLKVVSQEGNHRAIILDDSGYTRMPVLLGTDRPIEFGTVVLKGEDAGNVKNPNKKILGSGDLVELTSANRETLYKQFGSGVEADIRYGNDTTINDFDDYERGVINDPALTDQQKNELITEHRAGIEQNQEGIERFGALEQGEKPARDIQFAKKIKKGKQATSRFTRTVAESDKLTDAEAQDLQSRVGRGEFTYQTTTNAETIAKAKKLIQDLGYRGSVRYLTTKTDTVENSAVNQEARIMLMWQLGQEGQYGSDDYNKLCAVATLNYSLAGQTVQSARTFKNNTPQGQLFTIESEIRRLQRNIQERFGDGFKIEVPNELMERFIRAKTDAERDQIMEEIARVVAKQVPATLMEKMNAWRYLAMLFNPRTHIKNMASNEIFSEIVYDAKRFVASTVEDLAYKAGWIDKKKQGGVNLRNEADKALYKQMLDYYKQTYKEVGFKYSDADAGHEFTGNEFVELVNENRDIFNNKALEWARKHNSQWLTGEDYLASSKVFAKEMVSRMKAKGVSSISELSPEALNEMREEAYLEARKATFNNDNKLANAINRLAKTNNATKLIFDSLIPFKRTPMNLVARGVEFSPVGLLATLTNGAYQLANHKITANMFIDSLASGLTGSAISLLGYWLASKGIFKTKDEDEPARKSAFDETNGEQKYALDFGNATYTIEWADPIIMPLAIGAEVFNKGIEVEDAIDILATTIDPIFETSMLKGIMNSFTTYGNTPTEKFANIAKNTVANYASQYVPTLGGAIARTLDDTRRKTTFKNDNFFEKIIRSNKAKIPFLAETNEPYLDRNGNEVKNEDLGMGVVGRFALNMLSPGYYKTKDIDKYDEELYRLYESTGDISAMPSGETYNLTQDKTKYEFTDSQYTQFEKLRWQTETELVNEFIDSDTYQSMTDTERVETINKVRSYAQKVAKQDFLNEQGVEYEDKELNAVKEAESYGMTPFDYWAYKSDAGTKQAQKIEYLENSGLTDSQKEFLWSTDNYKKSYQEAYDKLFNK